MRYRNQASESTSCDKGVFLSLLSRNFDDRLSSNFHGFVILCICWDTISEKTGLWQLPIVPSVFKDFNRSLFYASESTRFCATRFLSLFSFNFDGLVYTVGVFQACELHWSSSLMRHYSFHSQKLHTITNIFTHTVGMATKAPSSVIT